MLADSPPLYEDTHFVDEFAGRERDDPLLVPRHPASVLGINEGDRVAYPLLVAEQLAPSEGNLGALAALGAEIDEFKTAGPASE